MGSWLTRKCVGSCSKWVQAWKITPIPSSSLLRMQLEWSQRKEWAKKWSETFTFIIINSPMILSDWKMKINYIFVTFPNGKENPHRRPLPVFPHRTPTRKLALLRIQGIRQSDQTGLASPTSSVYWWLCGETQGHQAYIRWDGIRRGLDGRTKPGGIVFLVWNSGLLKRGNPKLSLHSVSWCASYPQIHCIGGAGTPW